MKNLAISILVVMVVMAMFSILPAKVVVCILALAGVAVMFGSLLLMSLNYWSEFEKRDPERAHKMWIETMAQWEQQRQMMSLF